MGLTPQLLCLPQYRFVLLADVLRASPEPVFHAALGLIDPALYLGDGETILARRFCGRDLSPEDAHDHGGLSLGSPSLEGGSALILSFLWLHCSLCNSGGALHVFSDDVRCLGALIK